MTNDHPHPIPPNYLTPCLYGICISCIVYEEGALEVRNTEKYPITLRECICAVNRALDDEREKLKSNPSAYPIGGIHMAALREASIRLQRLEFAVQPIHEAGQ